MNRSTLGQWWVETKLRGGDTIILWSLFTFGREGKSPPFDLSNPCDKRKEGKERDAYLGRENEDGEIPSALQSLISDELDYRTEDFSLSSTIVLSLKSQVSNRKLWLQATFLL
uniref:Uncharacterized protein n=1 Tax=Nelumbo nucifera TaxID=4432 RepID=A0A822XL41_NELNU|nr:TPA_asm: hypothetical protein HUJ06_021252 [Nelumbo nucifera]